MTIKSAQFMQSVTDWKKCPAAHLPEYAFIGRSNVGKSSLINMLVRNSKLAKTSSKPGKTQTINHFLINQNWYLVDLPGYGYASISKTMREKWTKMIRDYLLLRENLQVVFVLVDSRLEPQKIDLDFINSLGEDGVPFAIIFTKTDKLSANKVQGNVQRLKNKLAESWEEMPYMMLSSAETGKGRDEILNFIEQINEQYHSSNKNIPNET
ncbi:MAG: YihA family ribosome biogenesis GTP-binding protein [Bacteroidales bacterium]|nr:YihA family ribosome biogenesis GTP-binding protein [Bacteroidales bacterium]MBR0304375.1 YihA family ribosome biogenesis GTP-binding protein [Bacteroidales bacterium]